MAITKHCVEVLTLSHTMTQGWLYNQELARMLDAGWRVEGATAVGKQEILVVISKRKWRWQK